MKDTLSSDAAKSDEFIPVTKPYRGDDPREIEQLFKALKQFEGATIRLVVDRSPKEYNFKGIAIWRSEEECWT